MNIFLITATNSHSASIPFIWTWPSKRSLHVVRTAGLLFVEQFHQSLKIDHLIQLHPRLTEYKVGAFHSNNTRDINYSHTCPSERAPTSNEQSSVLIWLCLIALLIYLISRLRDKCLYNYYILSQIIFPFTALFWCFWKWFFFFHHNPWDACFKMRLTKMALLLLVKSQGCSYSAPLRASAFLAKLLTQKTVKLQSLKTCQLRGFISSPPRRVLKSSTSLCIERSIISYRYLWLRKILQWSKASDWNFSFRWAHQLHIKTILKINHSQ